MQKIKEISFRTKLIFIVELFLITATIILGLLAYFNIKILAREALQNKLIAIASSTASILDAEKINHFQNLEDTQTSAYEETEKILKKITASNENVADIYIMTKSEREDIWNFIANASSEAIDSNSNGIIEEGEMGIEFKKEFSVTDFPEMKQAFEKKIADKEINCDSWGCWLSGYAPVLNSQGDAIAIVGVDISAQNVINYEKRLQISLLTIFGLIALISPIFLFFYLRHITDPFLIIIKSLDKFSDNLSTRINIKSKDEFGIIAKSFNEMATKLNDTLENISATVEERTQQIADEKNKTVSILKSIGDGVIVVDKNLKVTMFNKVAEKITKFSAKEVIGQRLDKIIEILNICDSSADGVCFINDAIRTGKITTSTLSTMLVTKDKNEVPIHNSASPLKNEDGEIIGCVIIFRDITTEYEIDKAKTEFVSLASHQLRTPLSAINWYTETLLDGDLGTINTKQKKYLDQIYQGNQRMVELVNSLLNVSRLEMGTFIIEPQETDIFKIADDVITEFTPKLKEKEIKINTIYDHEIGNLQVDPKLMRIIFQNLLSNSTKYNKIKEPIELKISKDDKNFNIQVTDNGLGIPEAQQKLIFSKFFRADNIRQTETEGTGLGLYLVKKIIDNVSGKISFVSKENKGTTFTVSLPLSGMQAKKGTKEIININK